MSRNTWQKIFSFIVMASVLISLATPGVSQAKPPARSLAASTAQEDPIAKIETQVLTELTVNGQTDFFVTLAEKADLSAAVQLKTKLQKGEYVFNTLVATAERTQKELRSYLDAQGVNYTPYYIANTILVNGGSRDLLMALASRPEVASVTANHASQAEQPQLQKPLESPAPQAPAGVEPNISFVQADQVWALGYTGQGVVLADNNIGIQWDHPALKEHYRGWNGVTVDHNYNWWDATGDFPREPGAIDNLGMLSTGVMVGDDGAGNQIGMAPGAKTIHCRDARLEIGNLDSWLMECLEWDLAPWDLNHQNPRPDLAPDAVNVFRQLWVGGGDEIFRQAIDNLIAAGILVLAGVGDWGWGGGGCGSVDSPGDYPEVLTSGGLVYTGGMPGVVTDGSSRGPSSIDGSTSPDIMAPGDNIRSAITMGGEYGYGGETNLASSHTAGLVALMWSANPALRGQVETTIQIIQDTAVPLTGQTGLNCGGDYTDGPNNDWGYGTIDALAAVQAALAYGGAGALQGTVTDSASSDPIQGAAIQATLSLTQSFKINTDATGVYTLGVAAGTYTIDASAFSYLPTQVTGVVVDEGQTVTHDFALDLAPTYGISVTVVDAVTGWPLYAQAVLRGAPLDPFWSDPLTGHFAINAPGGSAYTLDVEAWTPGYMHQAVELGTLSADIELVVELQPDVAACNAPGYHFTSTLLSTEDFEASDGGYTVGGANPSWEWGTPIFGPGSAHSGVNVWATGLISGAYNDWENSTLTSPVIDLSSQAGKAIVLDWWQWLQVEGGWDIAAAEASQDGGATWKAFYGAVSGDIDLNWAQHSAILDPSYAVSNFQFRFHLKSDGATDMPGWYVDDVGISAGECLPTAGGLVVGNVYNGYENTPLAGATVENDSGFSTLTVATADEALDDAFYVLFSPAGSAVFTATLENTGPDTENVEVVSGGAVWQDFYLPAGHVTFDPLSLHADLEMGSSLDQSFTLSNDGSYAANYSLTEFDKGFAPEQKTGKRINTVQAAPATGPDVLVVCAEYGNCGPLPGQLLALGGIGSVDTFDARYGTPTLDELLRYEVVVFWELYGADNPVLLGNVLADYIDAGGKVINAMWGVADTQLGRFANEHYSALEGSDTNNWPDCMARYNNDHPIMEGITEICDTFRLTDPSLTPGSMAIAWWDWGEGILAAVKNDRSVVSLGLYIGIESAWTGQVDQLVYNAVLWLAGSEVSWLSEDPVTGTLEAETGQQDVTVSFDAGVPAITRPGDYYATLKVKSDTLYSPDSLPVTMTVTAPDSYGVVAGTIQSLGYCDNNPAPIDWAKVVVESASGSTWTLRTDESGYYEGWFDAADGPYTLTVSAWENSRDQATGVVIEPHGAITTQDFSLRWLKPCVSVDPTSLEVDVALGYDKTTTLNFINQGAGDNLLWMKGGDFWLTEPVSVSVPRDNSATLEITFTAFPTMTVGDVYTTTLEAWNNEPLTRWWAFYIPVTMTVVEPTYGVAVSADQTGSGMPGKVVTYTLTVTNLSNGPTDSFTATLGAHAYATGLGPGEEATLVVGPLAMGERATFVVTVRIPGDAANGAQDSVVITISSAGDPTKTAAVSVTTRVSMPTVYIPVVWKTP